MDINVIVAIIIVVCIVIGFIIGIVIAKIYSKMQDKKIRKNYDEVIEGKRENFIEVDGKKIPAEKFRYLDEEGNEVLINLKGGIIEEDAKEEIIETTKETIPDIEPNPRKDSSSTRKKKRNIRSRTSIIRKYG